MPTQDELIKHLQTHDVRGQIEYVLSQSNPSYLRVKQVMAVYEAHTLKQEVFNALISCYYQVTGTLFLEAISMLAKRWERLGIDSAEKAIQQGKDDYELVAIFENGICYKAFSVYPTFDFKKLYAGLSEQMMPKSTLAGISDKLIERLAFHHSLSELDMQKVIMIAMDESLKVSDASLQKASAEFSKMNGTRRR